MKILVLQIKGGVSKTSIATSLALNNNNFQFITNDAVTDLTKLKTIKTHLIDSSLKKIPTRFINSDKDMVLDMGAMTGLIDPKIAHALKISDGIIVPTMTDLNSIRGAIETIKFSEKVNSNIFVIVNRVMNEKEYEIALELLTPYIDEDRIFMMKNTTLFKRIAENGDLWYKKIQNEKGQHMLNRTMRIHNEIYDEIIHETGHIASFKGRF